MTPSTQSPGEGELIARLREGAGQQITRYFGDLDGAIVPHDLLTQSADTIQRLSERLARMEEERRLDREAYDALRAAWSLRQASALHADDEKYRWACEKFDAAFDAASRLSRQDPKEGGSEETTALRASVPTSGSERPAANVESIA